MNLEAFQQFTSILAVLGFLFSLCGLTIAYHMGFEDGCGKRRKQFNKDSIAFLTALAEELEIEADGESPLDYLKWCIQQAELKISKGGLK